jgi:AcrR family transcriptional regulator
MQQKWCAYHSDVIAANRTRLDPRRVRTRSAVFAAARAVLRREGIGATTMDAIAGEAHVARSTLYRNWSSRDELLAEAFDDMIGEPPVRDPSVDIATELTRVLRDLAHALSSTEWGATLPAVVAAADATPELARRYGHLTDERRRALAEIVSGAVCDGHLPEHVVVDELVDALVGPLFYRRLVRRLGTPRTWIARHVDRTLRGFTT